MRLRLTCVLALSLLPCVPGNAAEPAVGPPRDPAAFRRPDLVELVTLEPTLRLDIRYAGADNLAGRPVYSEARAFLQRPAAEALARVHRGLREHGYGLLIFDGYRPWAVTRLFWDLMPADRKVYVADPAKGSRHNRGAAIDLTLFDLKTGREVPMPSAYDETTERAHVTFAGGPEEPRAARDLLIDAMSREGFFVYPYEWWHFDWKDWREYPVLDLPFASIHPATSAAAGPSFDLATARAIDLTWPFDEKTLYWPTSPSGFELKALSYGPAPGGYFYAANSLCAPEHGGTHLDAPIHFAEGGRTVDAVPLSQLIAPAVVLDVRKQALEDADYRLTLEEVAAWERAHGRIPDGAIVLLRTGWGERWPDRKRYFGTDTPGDASNLHFPSFGAEAASWLVRERAVAALGVDTASVDHGPSRTFEVHQAIMKAGVPAFENLAHLEQVPESGAWVVALPMKIAGGSGAPLRIVALVPADLQAAARLRPTRPLKPPEEPVALGASAPTSTKDEEPHPAPCHYSARSATSGSTRVARRAGT